MAALRPEAPAAASGHGGEAIPVVNPATGAVIATVAAATSGEVAEVVVGARRAQPAWEAAGHAGRARVLRRSRRWLISNRRRVIETLVSETGKCHEDAHFVELGYAAAALGFWARRAPEYLADERIRTWSPVVQGRRLSASYRPFGVVGVIGPWNFPLVNSFGDCVPALAAGNAVVLKPSELTPLTSLLMLEGMRESGVPDGVFQVVTGAAETGAALIDGADMVMFTGSTATGRKVMERAARTLTPVSLELGGKDPMIVLADADLERATNAAVYGTMQNSGQACTSVERVYVEASVYEPFVAMVERKVRRLRQGPAGGPGSVDVAAMTSEDQLNTVSAQVGEAVKAGARALTGGRRRAGPGTFYEPTVLVDVDHSMALLREETFGPTMPIVRVADAEEAVRLANDSDLGLSASVFTRDAARGERLARRLEAGTVLVNDVQLNYFALELPLGGWKDSGLGQRHGAAGIRKFCRRQAVLVTRRWPLKADLFWLPYSRFRTGLLSLLIRFLYGGGPRA